MNKKTNIIKSIVFFIGIGILFTILYVFYVNYYYNGFYKAEYNRGITTFTRDNEIKFSDNRSYKIDSNNYNDACFYKEFKVEPNTPYRITCMVKTKNVISENEPSDSGAQIFLVETVEHSEVIKGTNDWRKLEFMVYSRDKDTLKIGFRLGGDETNCKGTAWFSDFKVEKGLNNKNTNWNMACFIFKNIDVEINEQQVNLSMNLRDIDIMKENMERFKNSSAELSKNAMTVTYDIYEIEEPITSLTYSDKFGYYVGADNVKDIIYDYIKKEEYDYIFTIVRLGNEDEKIEIPTYDWIGLGGMDLEGIGYSNIRLPNNDRNYVYTYDYKINIFPEEVYIHEFLHTLERISKEAGYDVPELHSYNQYGYEEKNLTGLKAWYRDYMQCNIVGEQGEYIGINPIIYEFKPVHKEDFEFSIEVEFNEEPNNILEAIINIFKRIKGE